MSIKRFNGQIDYFGITSGSAFACTNSAITIATADVVTSAADGSASGVHTDVTGASIKCDYTVKCAAGTGDGVTLPAILAPLTIAAGLLPAAISTGWTFFVTAIPITTAAGALPSFSMEAVGVKGTCAAGAYEALTGVVLSPFAVAQSLFDSVTPTGGTLVAASYTIGGSQQTKPDETNATGVLDVAQVLITGSFSIQQDADDVAPTVALGEGWTVQQPLAVTGTVGAVTTWTMTATCPVARAEEHS